MSRTSSRRAANRANRELRQERGISAWAFMATLSTAGRAADIPMLTCSACRRLVTTLIDGECFCCHAPAEGKNFSDMTPAQCESLHACGIKHGQHVDGFDGHWIGCDEAKQRAR